MADPTVTDQAITDAIRAAAGVLTNAPDGVDVGTAWTDCARRVLAAAVPVLFAGNPMRDRDRAVDTVYDCGCQTGLDVTGRAGAFVIPCELHSFDAERDRFRAAVDAVTKLCDRARRDHDTATIAPFVFVDELTDALAGVEQEGQT